MIKVASFFTGAGGMDLGFEGGFSWGGRAFARLPFETVYACDVERKAKVAFDRHWEARGSSVRMDVRSIVDVVTAGEVPECDVMLGGFPCQPFSVAGRRKGFDDDRSHADRRREAEDGEETRGNLYRWMCRAIDQAKPKVFVAENVKGLMSIPGAFDTICSDFSRLGYRLEAGIVRALSMPTEISPEVPE